MSVSIRQFLTGFLFLIISSNSFAQVKVQGGFLYDSIQLGQRTGFYLSAKYPSSATVLFPDSSTSFGSFSYENRRWFATQSENGVSKDSAVYFIKTFDIQELQKLELPVFIINPGDCTRYLSNSDSIKVTRVSAFVPDTVSLSRLPLKIDTRYQAVDRPLNLTIIFLVVGGLLLLAGVIWMIFGQRINAYLASRRLQRQYNEFVNAYNHTVSEVRSEYSPQLTEHAVFTWKKYMEGLESRPYTKLTTTETIKLYGDEILGKHLRLADRAIYANDRSGLLALDHLKSMADDRFKNKLMEVMHGK